MLSGPQLVQVGRRAWAADGQHFEYAELLEAAADEQLAFRSLVDPDYPGFLNPASMPAIRI